MSASPPPRPPVDPPRRFSRDWRLPTPDETLMRRFGMVRAVGGSAYFVAVVVLFGIFGRQVWPLALGVPVLAVVTTAYFVKSAAYPRFAVAASLVADALVLGGAVAFLGGTGSGLVMLYAIVVVSAGILLGPVSAGSFTAFTMFLGVLQLLMEELGVTPMLLHRPELGDRLPILLVSLAGIASVGYLSATYASRLHQLVAEQGEEAEVVRERGRRRRSFVEQAAIEVMQPLHEVEQVADLLDVEPDAGELWEELGPGDRRRLAARLRIATTHLDAEVSKLADIGVMDETEDRRPEPVLLRRVVNDCLVALSERLEHYVVDVEVSEIKVVGDRRAARRVLLNLLENIADHTPGGTSVRITAVTAAGQGVLVVQDDGPGIPSSVAHRLFDPPGEGGAPQIGLPLVAELCKSMGAQVRYESPRGGGARFLVGFKLAPPAAPSPDDEHAPLSR